MGLLAIDEDEEVVEVADVVVVVEGGMIVLWFPLARWGGFPVGCGY